MGNTLKNLGEAELEIMQVIWSSEQPVTSNYILKELQGRRKWQLSTLMTSLSRLANKGFVTCDRSMGTNLYSHIVSESDYKAKESKNFLQKLYSNSIQNMVATLYGNKVLKASDMAELRDYLDKIEAEYSEED
ncbi:MAG: BlaI/MecI/CopY family transcriptional regulator [Lachnospiraceae bacterium]|nr:BlaI/MecI/CopY family transcriptional regulator [Lachnospiraceae bacterium]